MAKTKGRPYSFDYQAQGEPKRYLLSGIPPTLWRKVQAQCKREHIAVRQLLLSLVEGWLLARDPTTQIANAVRVAKAAHAHLGTPAPGASATRGAAPAQTSAGARGRARARRRPAGPA